MQRQLLLHAGLTALALAIGLAVTAPDRRVASAIELEDARWSALQEDLEAARQRLAELRRRLDAMPLRAEASGERGEPQAGPLEGIVPRPDDPPVVMERFARRLAEVHVKAATRQLVQGYTMYVKPLLPGFDDAAVKRVVEGFVTYTEATKAVPWGRFHLLEEDAEETWRQYLQRVNAELEAKLAREVPADKVELLMKRFAIAVPPPGEPLPSPKLGGDPRKRGR